MSSSVKLKEIFRCLARFLACTNKYATGFRLYQPGGDDARLHMTHVELDVMRGAVCPLGHTFPEKNVVDPILSASLRLLGNLRHSLFIHQTPVLSGGIYKELHRGNTT